MLRARQRGVPHGYVWSASDLATSNISSTAYRHLVHCSVSRSPHVFRLDFGKPFHDVTNGDQHVINCAVEPCFNQSAFDVLAVTFAPTGVTADLIKSLEEVKQFPSKTIFH